MRCRNAFVWALSVVHACAASTDPSAAARQAKQLEAEAEKAAKEVRFRPELAGFPAVCGKSA
eukprot:2781941-Rhodomonas_salina.1